MSFDVAVVNISSSTLENFEIKCLKPIPSSHYAFYIRSIIPGDHYTMDLQNQVGWKAPLGDIPSIPLLRQG